VSTSYLSGSNSSSDRPGDADHDDGDEESGGPTAHGFVVGTTVLGGENDLLTVKYQEEDKQLSQIETRTHSAGEIWEVAAHPTQKMLVSCWASTGEGRGLSVATQDIIVDKVVGGEGARTVSFDNKNGGQQFATVHEDGTTKFWHFQEGETVPVVGSAIKSEIQVKGGKDVAWDPNTPGVVIAASGGNFAKILDSREGKESSRIDTFARCLSVDANPNRPHFFLTAGEDGAVKFWDARKPSETVQQLNDGHQHWVTKARYNPFHDQLVISSSTDGIVCLWRATSVSSAPLLDMESDDDEDHKAENKKQQQDALVKSFSDNLDSVYGLAWSAVNAWVFASLSYDGKMVIHTVPSGEKYKILL
jgi:WD40 repeat protein